MKATNVAHVHLFVALYKAEDVCTIVLCCHLQLINTCILLLIHTVALNVKNINRSRHKNLCTEQKEKQVNLSLNYNLLAGCMQYYS